MKIKSKHSHNRSVKFLRRYKGYIKKTIIYYILYPYYNHSKLINTCSIIPQTLKFTMKLLNRNSPFLLSRIHFCHSMSVKLKKIQTKQKQHQSSHSQFKKKEEKGNPSAGKDAGKPTLFYINAGSLSYRKHFRKKSRIIY